MSCRVNNLPGAAATFAQLLRWDTDDDQHQLRSDGGATDDTGVVFFCGMGTIKIPEGLWRGWVGAREHREFRGWVGGVS